MRACRWRIGCIYRGPGPRMMIAAPRWGCPRRSRSRPSRRLRSNRSAGRVRSAFLAAWRWWTPATATIPSCARASLTLESATWPAFSRRRWCRSQASGRSGHRRKGAMTRPIRSRSRTSPSDCGRELGVQSNGGRALMNGCPRGLRGCVFTLHRAMNRAGKPTKEWLLIEWPEGEKEPTKYWLSTLPSSITFPDLVDAAKLLRWRIERDYQELKQEVGLGHYEGRGWRGFHHHATMCIAAYGFLVSERETIPPSAPRRAVRFPPSALPDGYRPRGSASASRTAHSKLDRNRASATDRRSRQQTAAMSMLRSSNRKTHAPIFMMQ